MKQAHGNWVTGDHFWDRQEDIALFTQRVDEGAHLLLVAQRRMGKTSLMHEVARRLAGRYICPFVDLQKSSSPADAIAELSLATRPHKSLWQRSKELFANLPANTAEAIEQIDLGDLGIRLRAGLTRGNWKQKGDQLFAILAKSEKPVLLLFDEVPIMINRLLKGGDFAIRPERRVETDEFMSWLRAASIRHKGSVRIVMAGSIGLEPVLRQARLSATLNTFQPFELKAWDEATAVECLKALADEYGVEFEDGAENEMVQRLGCCIPHHVQMFFAHVHAMCKRRGRMEFSAGEIGPVYKSEMLSTRGHAELTTYEDRLSMVLGREVFPLALDLLTEAAVTGHLTPDAVLALRRDYSFGERSVDEVEKEVLWVLEHDGYLAPEPKGYAFVSKLVRDWWKARHGFAYTPILQRGV